MVKSSKVLFSIDDLRKNQISLEEFGSLETENKLQLLCGIAHLAPSTHNTQPWRFLLEPESFCIDVYLDNRFVLPYSDVSGRQAVVSMGCALENLAIAAEYFRLGMEIKLENLEKKCFLPTKEKKSTSRLVKIARVVFKTGGWSTGNSSKLFGAIFNRKIMRAEFDPLLRLPLQLRSELESLADGKKIKLYSMTDPIRKLALSEFQGQADGYVINTFSFARELGNWLLPNDTVSKLGMPGVGFGLKDDQALRLHRGLSGKGSLEPEDGLRFALGAKQAIEKSPYIGMLSMKKDEPEFWLLAGRVLEKILLTVEARGYSSAIHAGVVVVPLVNRMLAASSGSYSKLAALFRVGKVIDKRNLNRPFSPRRELVEVILNYH